MHPRIVFLDDDPVIRIARYVLLNRHDDPWVRDFFAPELADLSVVRHSARGITSADGSTVELASGPVRNADIIVYRRGLVDAGVLAANPALRLIVRLGERADGVDIAAAQAAGVNVVCVPRRTLRYTAEHALLLMMALARRLLPADRAVREGRYDAAHVHPIENVSYNWANLVGSTGLHGSTLGVIGLGEVGTLVARLGHAFGMHVLYYKRNRVSIGQESALSIEYAALDDLLAASDFVSLHVDNTPQNANLIGAAAFAAMRAQAFFINVSRGRLVDEDALYDALATGRIAGAGLDTHRIEPRPAHDRFSKLDNVILTPHFAGGARSGVLSEIDVIFKSIHEALAEVSASNTP
ncbi:2-hydroxyacid dehydrogenase [Bordetella sp. BOR01]|uniref:2-hydroxyacid dehydrogenase n=1 Tax=Bordetella sp. BOR01 TaxID=2854779 RepID=UPI001C455A8A|nr:NAD(P)-dependent oxidoreductase [Bordetella sp. BOR01]MBV7483215.1 hypothetical protein [Bordetella sp. BOR01]